MTPAPLLEIAGLTRHFKLKGGLFGRSAGVVRAVDGISFEVDEGETLGIVGESGCGKSTTARLIVDLIAADSGTIRLGGRTLGVDLELRELRRQVQMVFQDSYASLNPRLTVEEAIAFGPTVNGVSVREATALAHELLVKVGLEPKRFAGRYPHELSGGQRQRVNIARALAFRPKVVILDEAVSALDKSVEAQVLNLLSDLKRELGLTYIFISHDLNVVRYMADRVMVMYLGEVAEIGPVESIYARPTHPYTQALLSAMPSMDPDQLTREAPLAGDPPNPINPPPGCRFHTRCRYATELCGKTTPSLFALAAPRHLAACHRAIPGSGHPDAPRRLETAA
ncbi:MAG: ATP-binding cassette domain-containing protein [Alphaproteobacteria bacterium]|nr:ATP-binding cassette domain-containing protein [Alphaproteobacteria bacterium]